MASIRQQSQNTWLIIVSMGYDSNGKKIKPVRATWKAPQGAGKRETQRLLNEFAIQFESKVKTGGYARPIKFEELAKQWLEVKEKEVKHSTYANLIYYSEFACKKLGHMKVSEITPFILQGYINEMTKDKAAATARLYFSVVSGVMEYAYKIGMIAESPCNRVTFPKGHSKEKEILTIEEMKMFLEYVSGNLPLIQQSFFMLAIFGGMRKGEIIGLQWNDIDFDRKELHVRRTAYYTKDRGTYTDTPKTKKSQRTIAIPDCVLEVLSRYRLEQTSVLGDCEMLFTTDGKKLTGVSTFTFWTKEACNGANVKRVSPHSFRHFYASLLIENGEDISTVSSSLGHSKITTTLNTYTHCFEEKKRAANMKVAEILTSKTENINFDKLRAM